jgi:hypothetical protein
VNGRGKIIIRRCVGQANSAAVRWHSCWTDDREQHRHTAAAAPRQRTLAGLGRRAARRDTLLLCASAGRLLRAGALLTLGQQRVKVSLEARGGLRGGRGRAGNTHEKSVRGGKTRCRHSGEDYGDPSRHCRLWPRDCRCGCCRRLHLSPRARLLAARSVCASLGDPGGLADSPSLPACLSAPSSGPPHASVRPSLPASPGAPRVRAGCMPSRCQRSGARHRRRRRGPRTRPAGKGRAGERRRGGEEAGRRVRERARRHGSCNA